MEKYVARQGEDDLCYLVMLYRECKIGNHISGKVQKI